MPRRFPWTSTNADQSASPSRANRTGIKLLCSGKQPVVDIVFVHGLNGDREQTWTSSAATASWPQLLLPPRVPNARILTFGYDASVVDWRGMVSQNRIGSHAMNLLTSLAGYREDDDTALVSSPQRPENYLKSIAQHTRGIAFLGTPHHGSGLAKWAELLAKHIGLIKQTNVDVLRVLQQDSEVLARIQDSFHAFIRARFLDGGQPIEITCFYEELPLPGIGTVVPFHSAAIHGYTPIGIHSNHMDMARFSDWSDEGFQTLTRELRRWVKQLGVPLPADWSRDAGPAPISTFAPSPSAASSSPAEPIRPSTPRAVRETAVDELIAQAFQAEDYGINSNPFGRPVAWKGAPLRMIACHKSEAVKPEHLVFEPMEIITVLRIVVDYWWEGEIGSRRGLFPPLVFPEAQFEIGMTLTQTLTMWAKSAFTTPEHLGREAVAEYTFDSTVKGDLRFRKNDVLVVYPSTSTMQGWLIGRLGDRMGILPG